MLGDPKVLILDEPTTGVDITERVRFRQIISELSADRAVIYSTHTSEDLELVAKEIILMKKGQIISAGPGSTLLAGHERQGVGVPYDRPISAAPRRSGRIFWWPMWRWTGKNAWCASWRRNGPTTMRMAGARHL